MGFRVHGFDVIEEGRHIGQEFFEPFPGGKAAGVDEYGDALFKKAPAQLHHFFKGFCRHHFSAGKGHAAAGFLVKDQILFPGFQQLPDGFGFSGHGPGAFQTFHDALPAAGTRCPVQHRNSLFHMNGFLRADRLTPAAAGAFFPVPEQLGRFLLAFRIVAPGTSQGTAFEKDRGPDTVSVVNAIFL